MRQEQERAQRLSHRCLSWCTPRIELPKVLLRSWRGMLVGGAITRVQCQVRGRFGQVRAVICVWDPRTVASADLAANRAALVIAARGANRRPTERMKTGPLRASYYLVTKLAMAKGWIVSRTCENQNALWPLLHTSVPFVHAAPYGMSQPVCGCLPPDLHVRHRSQVHTRVLILRLVAKEHRSGVVNAGRTGY